VVSHIVVKIKFEIVPKDSEEIEFLKRIIEEIERQGILEK